MIASEHAERERSRDDRCNEQQYVCSITPRDSWRLGRTSQGHLEALMSCCDETTARVPDTDMSRRSLFKGAAVIARSEERRVGKECRSRWSPYH